MKATEIKAQLIERAVAHLEELVSNLKDEAKHQLRGEGSTDEGGFAGTSGDYGAISQENSLREQAQINRREAQKYEGIIKALKAIDTSVEHNFVSQGCLITTNRGHYFISKALRPIAINNKQFHFLATDAPIYKVMAGKKEGDTFEFRNIAYEIKSIC